MPGASPKAISGRTRYLQVWLAFHSYPQVIPSVFNLSGFGPPRGLTPASACPWIDHLASRLRRATARPVRTRSRYGSLRGLASPRTATRWLILQKARRHGSCPLRLLVGARFQVLFHSPPGVLFTFPSRYWSTIGHRRVFRFGGWSPQLPTGFHVSGSTRVPVGSPRGFAYGALTLCRRPSQAVPLQRGFVTARRPAPQPRRRLRNRRFDLGPRSLATTRGISFDFSSSGYLDVSVPRVTSSQPMCSAGGSRLWFLLGSPIRRSTGRGPCAPHRGLSQLVTSFVGFLCQGIHRVPLPSSFRWFGTYIHSGAPAPLCDQMRSS